MIKNIPVVKKEEISSFLKKMNSLKLSSIEEKMDISLFQGISGLAIINFYVGKYINDSTFIDKGNELIELIIDAINNQNFVFKNLFSFCSGLTGVCFTINHLNKYGFIDMSVEENLAELESFIFDMGYKSIQVGKSDFLHGGMGILYYFIERSNNDENKNRVKLMIDAYREKAKIDDLGLRMENSVLIGRKDNEFDLGLAHGLSGQLIILSEAYKKGISKETVKYLIDEGLKYIENKMLDINKTGYNSFYPVSHIEDFSSNHEENLSFYDSRIAWCYGDLNIALMYLKLSKVFKNNNYYEKAIKISINASKRLTPLDAKIKNTYFCHGSSGISYMFLKLFKETNRNEFLTASNYWLKYTLDKKDSDFETLEDDTSSCLLNGGGGVLLNMLANHNNQSDSWNEIFILN